MTGAALGSFVEHRVDAGYGLERSSGPVVGGEAVLHVGGRWQFALRVQGGTLTARTAGALDRDVGEVGVEAAMRVVPWLTLRAGISRRAYGTLLARQRWAIVGLGAEARVPIAGGTWQGIARGALLPVVAVNGLDPDVAFAAASGMEYRRGSASLGVLYSLERHDFPAQPTVRLEQLSALTVRLALRLGTRPRVD